ncbi:MAG: NAD(P)(+) transhydrogenase (Re/Si-specific) subunit beta, partial [Arenicellales bacterium]|nr:NAD(P)(+) transhydrogenase (Re/Si-specific) subunit beta [Arenicellales bacterium]
MSTGMISSAYIAASILFILSLGGLSGQETARRGNLFGILGMGLAIAVTVFTPKVGNYGLILGLMVLGGGIGAIVAARVQMTAMPQLVALLHSLVGLAAVLVSIGTYIDPDSNYIGVEKAIHEVEIYLGVLIGAVTFTGSVIAFGKLQGVIHSRPLMLPGRHVINILIGLACVWLGWIFVGADPLSGGMLVLLIATFLALLFGVHMVMAIGGADMPVVISMLNSYSGWAAAATGFMLSNDLLIVTGALVGSSGAILSYIMCRAMNRHFLSVILGGFGSTTTSASKDLGEATVIAIDATETAQLLGESRQVVIVPGYGMAVAHAQHPVSDL